MKKILRMVVLSSALIGLVGCTSMGKTENHNKMVKECVTCETSNEETDAYCNTCGSSLRGVDAKYSDKQSV